MLHPWTLVFVHYHDAYRGFFSPQCSSAEVGEVGLRVRLLVLVLSCAVCNAPPKLLLLHVHGSELLLLGTIDLTLNTLEELEVGNDMLLSLKLNAVLLHELFGRGDLVLKAGLLGQSHAELSKLEKHFKVRVEVDHVCSLIGSTHCLEKLSLHALDIHADTFSDALEPVAITVGRVAILDCLTVGVCILEDIFAVHFIRCFNFIRDELADGVKDLAAGSNYGGLTGAHNPFDVLEVIIVANLDKLGLGLTHLLKQFHKITELLSVGGLIGFSDFECTLEALFHSVGSIEPVLDL